MKLTRRAVLTVVGLVLVLIAGWAIGTIVQSSVNDHINRRIEGVLGQLESAASGECYRVNVLRWDQDVLRFQTYQQDLRQAAASKPSSPTLRLFQGIPGISRRKLVELAHGNRLLSLRTAHNLTFLPFTNCVQAVQHPRTYVPPRPVPFSRYSQAYLRRLLSKSPAPPRKAHHGASRTG